MKKTGVITKLMPCTVLMTTHREGRLVADGEDVDIFISLIDTPFMQLHEGKLHRITGVLTAHSKRASRVLECIKQIGEGAPRDIKISGFEMAQEIEHGEPVVRYHKGRRLPRLYYRMVVHDPDALQWIL